MLAGFFVFEFDSDGYVTHRDGPDRHADHGDSDREIGEIANAACGAP